MASKYLVLPHLNVQHANALQAWWLVAPPSPMALHGFSRALGLRVGVNFGGMAIIHHGVQWLGAEKRLSRFFKKESGGDDTKSWDVRFWNETFTPQQVQGATYINQDDHIAGSFSKGLQPTARCHVALSLVLRVDATVAIDLDAVEDFLWSGRIAGGAITDYGIPRVVESADKARARIHGGFFVADRADLVQDTMQRKGFDGTEALLDILVDRLAEPKAPHWLSANVVGYCALESPKPRLGVRGNLPHAYAEAIVGLIQYQSVRQQESMPFWTPRYRVDDGVFLLSSL